ncbi:hypothetical protein BD309DRAFT_604910 [Dichomitus squalens]|nr:hypothetical protein BD309DRAFT_604910 [Dichomitus squalens]
MSAGEKLARLTRWIRQPRAASDAILLQVGAQAVTHAGCNVDRERLVHCDGIPFDPVFHSRLFVDLESAAFCVEETKLTKKLKSHLTSISMSCRVIATISERSCIARMGRSQIIIPQISYAICLIWPAFGTRSRHPVSRR